MKKTLAIVLVAMLALPVMAFLGLPYADDAPTSAGLMRVTGSLTFEDDINLYGARFTYGLMDDVALFGGVGIADPDGGDSEPYLQIGGQYTLGLDVPFELAVRAALGMVSWDDKGSDYWGSYKYETDLWTLNLGLLASKQLDEMITVYGFGGLGYNSWTVKGSASTLDPWGRAIRESYSDSDTNTELAIAGGAIFTMNDNLSFFGELSHIDELFISLGARYEF